MHSSFLKFFCYTDKFNYKLIDSLSKNTSLIYRNYENNINEEEIIKIKKLCKKKDIKLYLSNNPKLAIKLDLDGCYIPSFNTDFKHNSYKFKKKFLILGSAHDIKQIRIKEAQKVNIIFISPIFLTKKLSYQLGIYRFLNLKKITKTSLACLGGINKNNINILKMLNVSNIGGISFFIN